MMVGKEDLAFSLSLSLGPLQHPPRHFRVDADSRAPAAAEREGGGDLLQAGGRASSSSPSAVSSSAVSGGKGDNETGRACSGGPLSDEEDADGSRKKLRLSKDQSVVLEETFKEHNTLNPKQKLALAKKLKLRPRQVEVWFQNRRARTKLKQTEVDCELLKRCCEGLTEENRRLQKEVQELRALKMSPHLYAHSMTPPTTLTMCPSCERISSSSPAHPDHHRRRRHRPMPPQMGGDGSSTPWAPIPLRPSFSQNS